MNAWNALAGMLERKTEESREYAQLFIKLEMRQ
jgi:hypothetical protein